MSRYEILKNTNEKNIMSKSKSDSNLRNKSKESILKRMEEKKYDILENDNQYKYLLKMPMDSVSKENALKLLNDYNEKKNELTVIEKCSIEKMWLSDLEELKDVIKSNKY